MRFRDICLVTACAFAAAGTTPAQSAGDLATTKWRNLGPANFGGRIVDVEVDPTNRFVWYAATATGGVWKTTDNGATFRALFDKESVFSVGDIAIAPSDAKVIYVGTGEANNQRSSYWGDGVYKSTDAGKSWEHVGLRGTEHIGRVVVHPTDPNIVYVAALGALYSPNEERGLFRTKDGGQTWDCVKQIDANVGFVDVAIDPKEPTNLLAASYDRRRRAWDFRDEGDGSKLWRSTDGGDSWRTVSGIPDGQIGRIGVVIHPLDPAIAYAIVENNNPAARTRGNPGRADRTSRDEGGVDEIGKRPVAADEAAAERIDPTIDPELYPLGLGEVTEAVAAPPRPIGGEVYRSDDGGKSWTKVSDRAVGGSPHYYYGQIRVDPKDTDGVYVVGVRVSVSRDGGKSWEVGFDNRLHVDHHALWIDPVDPHRALLGNDGGIAQTWDSGKTWIYHDDLPIGQFYAITVDMREPYNVFGGTQDNGSWGFPSRSTTSEPLGHDDAYKIDGGDGFCVQVDPTDPDIVYSESQFGGLSRQDLGANSRRGIQPRSERGQPRLRFNWMAPLLISPHDPRTIYFGSQFLHRSDDRGDHWNAISADLTTDDPDRLSGDVPHCTLTTIAESPLKEGQLWVGTDDGNVWMSPDAGHTWVDLTGRFPDLPPKLWVSRVACSPHEADRAYVAFTGYREDDRKPYLYATFDGGTTFRSIVNDLPAGGSVNVVVEHPRNPDCVLVGTEFGPFASLDGGGSWQPLGSDLPTQPVHDLVVHPRDEDIVIGTHGRGIWILDGTIAAELDAAAMNEDVHVFQPRDGHLVRRVFQSVRYPAARGWTADAQENRAVFRYRLRDDVDGPVTVRVLDVTGQEVFQRRGETGAGLHEVVWQPRARGGRGGGGGGATSAGDYLLQIQVGERRFERAFRVHPAPGTPEGNPADAGFEFDSFAGDEDERGVEPIIR